MCNVTLHGYTRSGVWRSIHCNPAVSDSATIAARNHRKEHLMLDVVMLALGLGFFALGIGYAYACERL